MMPGTTHKHSATMTAGDVQAFCRDAGFPLDDRQAQDLFTYLSLLQQWNAVMNLVGTRTMRDTLSSLVVDSFHLATFLDGLSQMPSAGEIWDFGAGAGIPGIPLRIIWDKGQYWLVESRDKRAAFLATVLARIPMKNTYVYHGRAETFMPGRKASLIVSRAFMPWKSILDLCGPALAAGGQCIFLSNDSIIPGAGSIWKRTAQSEYAVNGRKRYLSALARA